MWFEIAVYLLNAVAWAAFGAGLLLAYQWTQSVKEVVPTLGQPDTATLSTAALTDAFEQGRAEGLRIAEVKAKAEASARAKKAWDTRRMKGAD